MKIIRRYFDAADLVAHALLLGDRGDDSPRNGVRSSADAVLGSLMASAIGGPAPPEVSESPTVGGTQPEAGFAAEGTPAERRPRTAALAEDEPRTREARLEADLTSARDEIAALRAAAGARSSMVGVGVARRSDLLVLQELETEELRDRLAEANGCAAALSTCSCVSAVCCSQLKQAPFLVCTQFQATLTADVVTREHMPVVCIIS